MPETRQWTTDVRRPTVTVDVPFGTPRNFDDGYVSSVKHLRLTLQECAELRKRLDDAEARLRSEQEAWAAQLAKELAEDPS